MRLNSIRARMTAAFALGIALLMLCVCGGLTWYARHAAERNADMLLSAAARKVIPDLGRDGHPLETGDLAEDQEALKADNIATLIVDAQGRVLYQSQRSVPAWPRKREDGWRVKTVPAGSAIVLVGMPWRKTESALKSQAVALFGLGLLTIVAAAVGAWLLVGHTLSPIGLLSRQAQTASAESLRVRLIAPSHDAEIVDLVATLNGLLTRLSETVAAKSRFHAAASHELRTPLQALSGHLELALNRPRTTEEYLAVLGEAHVQTQRLTQLVRDLLLLSQLDSAPLPPKEPVDLTEVCERSLCSLASLIEARALHVRTDFPPEAVIEAAPNHVEMLARNLVENALKYAAEGGNVTVQVRVSPDSTRLTLFNECAPCLDWNAEKLFEPFYRPDASRNSKTGGSGLGLAICKAIADANGWQLSLRQEANGVTAEVGFPSEGMA